MKYLEAKALAEEIENKATEPAEEDKAVRPWPFKITPEAYLSRSPDGPNADLARAIIAQGENES